MLVYAGDISKLSLALKILHRIYLNDITNGERRFIRPYVGRSDNVRAGGLPWDVDGFKSS